jgi:transcriptional regulator with XRE-family HTH domain
MKIGDKIRYFGESKFGNVTSLAFAMGMKPPSLHKYMNGEREPGAGILKKLLILGCDMNWLLDEGYDMITDKRETYGTSDKDIIHTQQQEIKQLKERLSKIEKLLK